jgi:hydrogenase/urease accessory protein HupE
MAPLALAMLFMLLLAEAPAAAHPLLQGAMHVAITRDRVTIQVTASAEELAIAASAASGRVGASREDRQRRHGDYLMAHLLLDADGRRLAGQLEGDGATATAGGSRSPSSSSSYLIAYSVPPPGAPARIALRPEVLSDVAPGPSGPWQVTYLVTATLEGRPLGEPRLLTAGDAVTFDCDFAGAAPPARAGARGGGGVRLFAAYLREGILHILGGLDHLLFVAALLLAAATFRDLIKVVVAFTVAHATTLTLCALRLVRVPSPIVEPLIAASIIVVAAQNLISPGASRRAPRLVIAFLFGLLHGCGFASGALQAMRVLPAASIGLAIVAFSLGVEVGHQVVIVPAFLGLRRIRRRCGPATAARVHRFGSALIALAGVLFLVAALRR